MQDNSKLSQSPQARLSLGEISSKYNDPHYWAPRDQWHELTAARIEDFIKNFQRMLILESTALVLNLGSGGNDQGIISKRTIHVDVAIRRIMGVKDSILG